MARKLKHMEPTDEDLARIGAVKQRDVVVDKDADPDCPKCNGTGEVYRPDRIRGGHYCPCTLRRK